MDARKGIFHSVCVGRRANASTCSGWIAVCLTMVNVSGHFVIINFTSKHQYDVSYFETVCYSIWVPTLSLSVTALTGTPLLAPHLFPVWRWLCRFMRFGTLFQVTVCHKAGNYLLSFSREVLKKIGHYKTTDFSPHCYVKGKTLK